jgi:hypothetical protein
MQDVFEDFAVVTARVVFAGTGAPIDGVIDVTAPEAALALTVLDDGTFALSGDVGRWFPLLSTKTYNLHLQVVATSSQFRSGTAQQVLVVALPAGTVFPPPIDAGILTFAADPISIWGQVTRAKDPTIAIGGASVTVIDAGPPHPPATTDPQGMYQLNGVQIVAPAKIQCSAAGFTTQTRMFLPDFSLQVNEEYFRLAP